MGEITDRDIETASRLSRIEARLDEIYRTLEKPVQPEQCAVDSARLHARINEIEEFKDTLNQRIAWVGGALAVIGAGITLAIQWSLEYLKAIFRH